MTLDQELQRSATVLIRQKRELRELLAGFEGRNKYSIETPDGQCLGYVAEEGAGFVGTLSRQFLGHWRAFDLTFLDKNKEIILRAHHPFRALLQRLAVSSAQGKALGLIQQKLRVLTRQFEVVDNTGRIILSMSSPVWRLWTFPFVKNGIEVAVVQKKWGGLVKESLMDADSFQVTFHSRELRTEERLLILAGAIFIDIQYFEKRG